MISVEQAIETTEMFSKEHLDVRTITMGISLLDTMKYSNIAGALSVKKIGSKNSMPELEDVINYHGVW